MSETRLSIVDRVYSKTQILLETLETLNQLRGESYVSFGSRTFVPMSGMCKKQTSVSHSSTESEVVSLGAVLRIGGIPALGLRDEVIEVLQFF